MRAIFHRFGGLGPVDATVLQIHDDGIATLDVTVPGQPATRLFAPRGSGEPGTWQAADPEHAAASKPKATRPRRAKSPVPAALATGVPEADPLAGPDTCLMCLRKGRWPGFYCCDACEARAATPASVDTRTWGAKRNRYTA